MIGKRLGQYEITAKIGQGGMGEVYQAHDTKLEREVALKILPAAMAEDAVGIQRFQREAKALAALNHPNIVTIYSVESIGSIHFLTMELLGKETLRSAIRPGGMELEAFLELAIPITEALRAAHEQGVVHRDLKPQNIMLSKTGVPKILDFGLAKYRRPETGASLGQAPTVTDLTSRGEILGTVDYMSPEQVRGEPLDTHSDLFSLGVIFYELLSGQHVFRRSSAPETLSAVLSDPVPDLHAAQPRLPQSISRIVRRCLEKDPQRRVQSALDLRNELKDLQRELHAGRTSTSDSAASPIAKPRRGQTLPWILAIAALFAALLLWRTGIVDHQAELLEPSGTTSAVVRVAILPFTNQGSEDDAFFVEGMREEIASRLGAIEGLGIISQTSASGLRVGDRTLQELGTELASEYVMTAAVYTDRSQTHSEKVKVTPRVVRVRDNLQLWSESFTAELVPGEIFAIQAEIAERVAQSIDAGLVNRDNPAVREEPTLDAGAYDDYLLGRYYWNRRTGESLQRAEKFFERAIERDPAFVRAYAGLADCVALYAFYDVPEALQKGAFIEAEQMARKAVSLDPQLGEAYASLAFAQMYGEWDWEGAERNFRRALELSPDYAVAHYWYVEFLSCKGLYEQAVEEAQMAVDLEPALPIARHLFGVALLLAGRLDESEVQLRRALELEPEFRLPHFALSSLALARGDFAAWQREVAIMGLPREVGEIVLDVRGGRLSVEEGSAGLARLAKAAPAPPSALAQALTRALIGDLEGSMRLLEQSVAVRDVAALLVPAWVDVIPAYAPLSSQPSYPALLEKMGLHTRLAGRSPGSR